MIEENSFDVVLSCHCIEHQPDLIQHFMEVSRILRDNGRYLILAPDKTYCFDYFVPTTTISHVMQAHADKRITHTLQSLIDNRAMITHNDVARHWQGDHGQPAYYDDKSLIMKVIEEYKSSNGQYLDCHAWQFTSKSFRDISNTLFCIGASRLYQDVVLDAGENKNTFLAIMTNMSQSV